MSLNISKGNMYAFVSHTWNSIKGECSHNCSYCFMKIYGPQKPVRLDNKEFKSNLGIGNFIFVGSSCDMWAEDIPTDWILETLDYCDQFENKYLFQTKNPNRIISFAQDKLLPPNSILGTTIETNLYYKQMGIAPKPRQRSESMEELSLMGFDTMITVEPIMNFTFPGMTDVLSLCNPNWVSIGADSKGHNLPEPDHSKIVKLITQLRQKDIKTVLKENLLRLLK